MSEQKLLSLIWKKTSIIAYYHRRRYRGTVFSLSLSQHRNFAIRRTGCVVRKYLNLSRAIPLSLVQCSSWNGEVGSSIIQTLKLYTRFFEADNSVENKFRLRFRKKYFVRFNRSVASEITFLKRHRMKYCADKRMELKLFRKERNIKRERSWYF